MYNVLQSNVINVTVNFSSLKVISRPLVQYIEVRKILIYTVLLTNIVNVTVASNLIHYTEVCKTLIIYTALLANVVNVTLNFSLLRGISCTFIYYIEVRMSLKISNTLPTNLINVTVKVSLLKGFVVINCITSMSDSYYLHFFTLYSIHFPFVF